ncbi:hypothetical protein JXL19_12100, partial [bacterium]|nr:hypothetical protein [bacterium]
MFIKTIRYILYLILLSSLIISFPNQPKAAFDIGHLIQVVYRPDDAEVGIDLDELRNLNLSQKNHTIKGPGTTFDINRHFTSSHSWDNINMGIFSLEMDSNQEWFAYFITTKPTAPQPSGSSFYAFKSAFDAIMGYYREIDKSDGEREGLLVINPTHHSSYFVKMNSTTTPGQYAGLNFKCCLDGEANLEDFKTKTFIDLYLYKIHDLGRGKVELIQGDSTPYVAVLRVFSDGTTILNPYENDAVNLTLDLDGNGGVELSPPNKIYFQDTEISFDKGIDISLTAKPSAGWKFAGWGGSLMGLENPVLLNLDSYKTVTATFTEISPVQFNLDLTITGQGFIDIDPPG